jgi:UDP-glucose 4-epimerase
VLEFMRTRAPKALLLFPSSAAVYGATPAGPIDEEAPLNPVSLYGEHKKMAEELCASSGLRVALLRLFSVYGPGLRKQLLWDACRKLSAGERTFGGDGTEKRDWVHVEDAAAFFVRAAQVAPDGFSTVNVGSGRAVSTREVLTTLFAAWSDAGEPVFTGAARPGDPQHYQAATARARSWGWRPERSLADGIAEYVRWFRSGAP